MTELRTAVSLLTPNHPPSHTQPPTHHVNSPPTSFRNPWPSYQGSSPMKVFRTRFLNSSSKNFVPIPTDRSQLVPVRKPNFLPSADDAAKLKATWFGHASFLIETPCVQNTKAERGLRLLVDPVWSTKVGPYNKIGPTRFIDFACTIEELPEIDAVLISHDHYDHLDSPTLSMLNTKQKGHLRFFGALGIRNTLTGLGVGIREDQITELDWWDGVKFEKEGVGSANFVCTPAQHRSGRAPWNFDKSLWCSWVVSTSLPSSSENKNIFFAGDTGYCSVSSDDEETHHAAPHPPCPAFKEIGDLYGPFDLALLPIGE